MRKMGAKKSFGNWAAFTLVEMLVVIAIMAILAALIFPVVGAVNRIKIRRVAQSEMARIETAIEAYKLKTGVYPPDSSGVRPNYQPPYINQLYYELVGSTASGEPKVFATKDGKSTIPAALVKSTFGVDGFSNSSMGQGGDEGPRSDNFLKTGIKAAQIGTTAAGYNLLVCSVGWPATSAYQPVENGLNPWRYVSSNPTNNPKSFDLWVDVIIGGKTNRICNWSPDKPIIVSTP